jgi:large subunit ribosomal protein L18
MPKNTTKERREQRIRRNRSRFSGTAARPRLSVFRSNKNIHLQLIDDVSGVTLASVSTKELKSDKKTKTEEALALGELLAKKAKEANIKSVVFDRRFYKYHGRVKAVAEGVKSGGINI